MRVVLRNHMERSLTRVYPDFLIGRSDSGGNALGIKRISTVRQTKHLTFYLKIVSGKPRLCTMTLYLSLITVEPSQIDVVDKVNLSRVNIHELLFLALT